jgi:GNAT superfamily N-acetyltransferase
MKNKTQFAIDPLDPADLPILLELIRKLALFEKLEHEFQATVASLNEAFFGPKPDAGAFLAKHNGEPAGYAIYFFTFSSFVGRRGLWLEDLYVRPEFRRQGLGLSLIKRVASLAAETQCGRLEWSALNWNKNALDVYAKLGAKIMEDWVILRMDATGFRRLATPSSHRP